MTTPQMNKVTLQNLVTTSTPESFIGILKRCGEDKYPQGETGFEIMAETVRRNPDSCQYQLQKTQILGQYGGNLGPFAELKKAAFVENNADITAADIKAENEALRNRVRELEA